MKWQSLIPMIAFLFLLMFAPPADAQGKVFGLPVQIEAVSLKEGSIYYVDTRRHGRTQVRDTAACGPPALGSAYMQYVQLENGVEYRTLYAQNCAYQV